MIPYFDDFSDRIINMIVNFDNNTRYHNAMSVYKNVLYDQLAHFLSVTTSVNHSSIKRILIQILNCLNVIHNILKLNYNSLKLSNIFVGDKYTITISGFTMSNDRYDTRNLNNNPTRI